MIIMYYIDLLIETYSRTEIMLFRYWNTRILLYV